MGRLARNLFDLGLFEEHALFKIRSGDSEAGFTRVVRFPLSIGGSGAVISRLFPSRWSAVASRYHYIHFSSPHFFHLADRPRVATGTVADMFFLSEYKKYGVPASFRWYFRREMKFLGRLAAVVAISETTGHRLRGFAPDVPVVVIHPWTDDQFAPRGPQSARSQLGLPADKVILLHVGAERPMKNLEMLYRAMDGLGPDYYLVRIGPRSPQDGRIGRRMARFDSVSDVAYPLFFNAADVLLQPSRDEGVGVPVIEAINSKTPIVASDIPVFREVLGSTYPYLASVDQPADWIARIHEVINAGRARSVAAYAWRDSYFRKERAATEFALFIKSLGV